MIDKIHMGKNVDNIIKNDKYRVYHVNADDGKGVITMYNVYDGIVISFNDFHTLECKSEFKSNTKLLCIDHCREGRIEQDMGHNRRSYLSAGDIRIDNRTEHAGDFYFPLSHYHGITISYEVEKAQKVIEEVFPSFPVFISGLFNKYCNDEPMSIIRGSAKLNNIFSQLYIVPNEIREYYFKIKVLELLLLLKTSNLSDTYDSSIYFYKNQTEKVKAIYELMTQDLQTHYTLATISKKYNISLTSLKNCFKGIYGEPISTFMCRYRMNKAASLLTTTSMSISDIAWEVGYENSSKFSGRFKNIMGVSPRTYRSMRQKIVYKK